MGKLNKIKRARLEAGLTIDQLRKQVKTSPKKIVAIERGEIGNTTLDLMKKIAVALDSSIEELFLSEN
ncbi:helix-turn-helix transcriptional regulator [Clostridium saccharobutylicum]|uniref:Helix-turn-helix domain protein n=1 Tax=Clostridium saccharobutylicum TaxID=169679 RepID=A0A1S8NJZ9_CLOSA|nr:helix-turn-helix domain-containing protein [Clostridium saccharobutylicum]OOM16748.1 helix-turn-helix domain protein [Clostridium saccharobutylicum]